MPKHSLFGQSFGDLDAHKASRDSANDDIERVKRRIGILKQDKNLLSTDIDKVNKRISEISNEIRSTIEDRSKLHDFEKFGHNRQDLQFKLHSLLGKTGKLDFEICGLNSDRDEYFTQEKHRYGVVDLEIKIAKVQQMKMQFLDSFKNEDNKEKRKRLHREAWLKQRARA